MIPSYELDPEKVRNFMSLPQIPIRTLYLLYYDAIVEGVLANANKAGHLSV
jgi:hypothetical protein